MKYAFNCEVVGCGYSENEHNDMDTAEDQAVRHLLEDHGYSVYELYSDGQVGRSYR